MRHPALIIAFLAPLLTMAGSFTLRISAPEHKGSEAILYRYDDLFTLRLVRIAEAMVDEDGNAVFSGDVDGTTKARLRIGRSFAELYLRPGSALQVRFLPPAPDARREPGGTVRAEIEFLELDAVEVNALVSGLNAHLDDFIAQDLATDEDAGMDAVREIRSQNPKQAVDTAQRPAPTIFIAPTWNMARTDTFERKLRHYYAEVKDPWFHHYMDNSLAGLRLGPRTSERELFERYLKGSPVHYDDPEFVRFVRGLFQDHLLVLHAHRHNGAAFQRALAAADPDSLKAVFARHDFLKDDDRLCELVMLDQLYLNHNNKMVGREAAIGSLERAASASRYPEHRAIAANMLWDLTAMRAGGRLPPMRLTDLNGRPATLDSLLPGAACIVVTASRCTYCELEMAGLEKLRREYKDIVTIIAISMDRTPGEVLRYRAAHPGQDFHWLRAEDGRRLAEDLRVHSLPMFLLLNDGVLVASPAPLPSAGLGAYFHRARVGAEEGKRIKVWDD